MSTAELIEILENRMSFNAQQRSTAVQRGDIQSIAAIDYDNLSTNAAISVLKAAQQAA